MEVLKVRDLCKTYIVNKIQNNVLRNIRLSLKQGEMVGIMGPSGSGKTTLLYTISGMDSATTGSVIFDKEEITKFDRKEMSSFRLEKMGFVFQQMYMLKNLSVYDNIIIPAYESKEGQTAEGRVQINERANKLMKKLDISDISDHEITEVSGGQLQRACICRSLINNPKIIFADEPTGALNRQNSEGVMDELNKVNEDGTSILIVTHDTNVASRCERVLYIEDGTIRDEYVLGKYKKTDAERGREKSLSDWLLKMGW
ncbi:MAG: ABC transporter ATP-binding protein [Suipraeoptans sp.]